MTVKEKSRTAVKSKVKTKRLENSNPHFVAYEEKRFTELNKLLAIQVEKNKELNELLAHHQERITSLESENRGLKKQHKDMLSLCPVLEEYDIEELNKIAEILKVEPHELVEATHTPSAVIKTFSLPTNPHKIVKIAEKHSLFNKSYKVKRLRRLTQKKEKYTTTVFFSILGTLEVQYWYKWEKNIEQSFNHIWKRHKKAFMYLEKN